MEVMLPTALGGAAALIGAVAYGILQPAGGRGDDGARGTWFAPTAAGASVAGERVDLASFLVTDLDQGLARAADPAAQLFKRVVDLTLASLLLVLASPVLILAAILIPLESAGPVFYRQERVGKNGKTFKIVKFRSMRQDAEANGAVWAKVNDDRVTRIGRFIRRMRIDEIPQAYNVLTGDMSFVGPRPERPEFVELLNNAVPHYAVRHDVKPGITGWAQVKCAYGASVEDAKEKHRYDLFYLKNNGLLMDLKIVLLTVRVALFGVGAR